MSGTDAPFVAAAPEIVRALLGDPDATEKGGAVWRYGRRGSLAVDIDKATFFDHERGEGGGMIDLVARARRTDKAGAVKWLTEAKFIEDRRAEAKQQRRIVAVYDYKDANGETRFQIVRFDPKDFRQRRPDGNGNWIWNLQGVEPLPYRLAELLAAAPSTVVFIVEGEKDVEALRDRLLIGTCNPGGAGKWPTVFAPHFAGRRVAILPDNDSAGERHARDVAQKLSGPAASVRIVRLPGLPPKGDVSDWLDAGGTAEELEQLAADAPEWNAEKPEPAAADPAAGDHDPRHRRAGGGGGTSPRDAFDNHANVEKTEDAIADAFAEHHAGKIVFDHTAGCWWRWQGRWTRDERSAVFHEARLFCRSARTRMTDPPAAIAKIAFAASVERAARADPRLAVSAEIWDRDRLLLGTPTGIVDLRTGKCRPAVPDLYISRSTAVAPAEPEAAAPLWLSFLNDATGGDAEMVALLQRLCGYLLTGDVTEEVLTFLYGRGGNGKGVFLNVLTHILGEYAVSVPIEAFTAGSRLNLEYYRAQMAGARLVTACETEAQATWAESQIKEMTGNETALSARHPYGQPFTFLPQFKIILVGNYAPKLKGRSAAMERRLRVVPFNSTPVQPDPNLKNKLRQEYPAILRWMIDGCLVWQRDGLGSAAAIKQATGAYFEQQDAFRRWIDERCILAPELSLKPGVLLTDFAAWARANGEEAIGSNAFAELIDRTPGLRRVKSHRVRLVQGIGLRPLDTPGDGGDGW